MRQKQEAAMYKAIHHDGYKSLVDVSEYLARHDIVYRRPALKPYEGLPVGDGKMGGLLLSLIHI